MKNLLQNLYPTTKWEPKALTNIEKDYVFAYNSTSMNWINKWGHDTHYNKIEATDWTGTDAHHFAIELQRNSYMMHMARITLSLGLAIAEGISYNEISEADYDNHICEPFERYAMDNGLPTEFAALLSIWIWG